MLVRHLTVSVPRESTLDAVRAPQWHRVLSEGVLVEGVPVLSGPKCPRLSLSIGIAPSLLSRVATSCPRARRSFMMSVSAVRAAMCIDADLASFIRRSTFPVARRSSTMATEPALTA